MFGRDNLPFSVTWTGTGGNADLARPFNGFRELANEQARSRIYGGIHFEFDQLASFGVCIPLAITRSTTTCGDVSRRGLRTAR